MAAKNRTNRQKTPDAPSQDGGSTPDQRATILTTGSQNPIKSWPGLFDLHEEHGGKWRVELAPELEIRAVRLRLNLDNNAERLVRMANALMLLLEMKQCIGEVHSISEYAPSLSEPGNACGIVEEIKKLEKQAQIGFLMASLLEENLAPLLRPIVVGSIQKRQEAKKTALKTFGDLLKILAGKEALPRKNGYVASAFISENNALSFVPVSWIAIRAARELIESTGELPNKSNIKQWIEERHPETNQIPKQRWTTIFKEAGLDALDKAAPFSAIGKRK